MSVPTQASLDAIFARAKRVRVLEGGAADERPLGGSVLVDIAGDDVARVRDHLRIVEVGARFHCMCYGDLAIELLEGDAPNSERRITTLGFHHARSLRHPAWSSDAMLVDGPALVRWLATRGVTGPLRAYEDTLERMRRADHVRRVWLQAAPPGLGDLERHEATMAAHTSSPTYDEPEALVRSAYATTADATRALLSWFGSGAGPWSGYPSYEALAEGLLVRLGLDVAREVTMQPPAGPDTEVVMRGAARLFSSWNLVAHQKSAVGDVPAAAWNALRPYVQAMGIADNTERFEYAASLAAEVQRLREQGAPRSVGTGVATVAVSNNGALSGLLSDGRTLYAGEGNDIVAFDDQQLEGRTLYRGTDPGFDMAGPVSQMIMVAHLRAGTIGKVLAYGSDLIVMVRDQQRPLNVVIHPGTVAWLNAAHVPHPVRGMPHVVQRMSVMVLNSTAPAVVRAADSAFSLVIDDERLYWCETAASGQWEIWSFGYRRTDPPRRLATIGEPSARGTWFPALRVNARYVVWANPDQRALLAIDKRPGSVEARPCVLAKTRHPPAHVVVDDVDAFALTGDSGERSWHVEHAPAREAGDSTLVASYERQLWDRPGMVIDARGLFFTTNDRVLSLPRR